MKCDAKANVEIGWSPQESIYRFWQLARTMKFHGQDPLFLPCAIFVFPAKQACKNPIFPYVFYEMMGDFNPNPNYHRPKDCLCSTQRWKPRIFSIRLIL